MDYYVRRARAVICSFTAAALLLAFRLYDISSSQESARQVLSGQYTRRHTFLERTGLVYDAKGLVMSHDVNGAVAVVNPAARTDFVLATGFLADNSSYSLDEILALYDTNRPFTLLLDCLPQGKVPQGIYVYPRYVPEEGGICRHILGYRSSDGKGMDGIYKSLDLYIDKGSPRVSYKYTADALGGIMEDGLFYIEDTGYLDRSGLVLTINYELQKTVDEICDERLSMGAVLVSDLSDGSILALSSRPLYDKNNIADCLDSQKGELINRAFALYTPGSVFKAVVAAAALEKDPSLFDFEYECTGKTDVSGKTFRCHEKNGHGLQTMEEAFANSCNTYFIELMKETGFENLLIMCSRMGLGQANAIDGFFVKGANMPSFGKAYPDAYKANFAFGQGDLMLSSVDVSKLYGICATGIKRELSVVKGIYGEEEKQDIVFERAKGERVLSEETVMKMRSLLCACVDYGTGSAAGLDKVTVGGKTATAQSGQYKDGKEVLHKWFAGVFPMENPRYCVVVLCDGNGDNNADPKKTFAECAAAVVNCCDY